MGLLFFHLSDQQAHTYRLVLSASGIPHQIIKHPTCWAVMVPDHCRRAAITAVALYLEENSAPRPDASIDDAFRPPRTYSVVSAILVLTIIHWAVQPGYEHRVFVEAYGADSTSILGGQVYRCLTALLFHNGWPHLFSNLFGLTLFGTAVAVMCGWGVGWLMILLAGALGNWVNACWYGPGHLSVGASTAVFAAVGLCAALTFGSQMRRPDRSWRAWLPLGAGLALLAFLGASPQTDLMAHLYGFLTGLGLGGLYAWRFVRPLSWIVQLAASLIAAGMLVSAWLAGIPAS